MPGIVKLEMCGEVIYQNRFTSTGGMNKVIAMWEKMYPKKFNKCKVVIEKEKGVLKTKSPFKKGSLVEVNKKIRVSRGTAYRYYP